MSLPPKLYPFFGMITGRHNCSMLTVRPWNSFRVSSFHDSTKMDIISYSSLKGEAKVHQAEPNSIYLIFSDFKPCARHCAGHKG